MLNKFIPLINKYLNKLIVINKKVSNKQIINSDLEINGDVIVNGELKCRNMTICNNMTIDSGATLDLRSNATLDLSANNKGFAFAGTYTGATISLYDKLFFSDKTLTLPLELILLIIKTQSISAALFEYEDILLKDYPSDEVSNTIQKIKENDILIELQKILMGNVITKINELT